MGGCSGDSQVEKPVEQLCEEIVEREAKPLQSRSAWKESVWMRSWLEADELRRSIGRFPKDQKNFKLLNLYWTNTKNLNLELKANRSEGIENEDNVPTAPPAPVFAGISSVIINSVTLCCRKAASCLHLSNIFSSKPFSPVFL